MNDGKTADNDAEIDFNDIGHERCPQPECDVLNTTKLDLEIAAEDTTDKRPAYR